MAPAVEVLLFEANDAYRSDPSIINPTLDFVADWKGSAGIYHGLQVENQKTGYLFIVWDTLEDHLALINDPIYPSLGAALGKCVASPPAPLFHVFFEPVSSIAPILNAPYTALAQLSKLRNGKTEDDLKEAMALVGTAKDVKGSHGAAFGRTVEKDDVYAFLTSWDSPADHLAAQTNPVIANFLTKVKETITDFSSAHVQLRSYRKRYQ